MVPKLDHRRLYDFSDQLDFNPSDADPSGFNPSESKMVYPAFLKKKQL
jgi:hypothetical protein